MVFSSIMFIFIFLPAVLVFYYLFKPARNIILLIGSLLFYAWGEPVYVILLLFSATFNYIIGIDIDHARKIGRNPRQNLIFAIIVNVFVLSFFKYYGFIIDTLNYISGSNIHYTELALPIGVSFYTFQALSYIVDVYRGIVRPQKNYIKFAEYISMFPQLIAGPIVKYKDIALQLEHRYVTLEKFGKGAQYFIFGLAKKVLLANNLGLLYSQVSDLPKAEFSTLTAWIGIIAYTLQIYFDFSGYSDMATGLGKMMGFEFLKNFNYPYISKSITEFWRRWHISLSTWFREYIYIPMGGNRVNTLKHIRNIFIVWFLTGLWHGSSWNFVFWGLYYCVFLLLEKYLLAETLSRLPSLIKSLYTMIIVIIGWVFFSIPSMSDALSYIAVMFGHSDAGLIDTTLLYYLKSNAVLLVISIMAAKPEPAERFKKFAESHNALGILFLVLIFILCISFLVYDSYNPFLYFRF